VRGFSSGSKSTTGDEGRRGEGPVTKSLKRTENKINETKLKLRHWNRNVQKEKKMKKLLVPTILGVLFLLTPVFAMAASITGSVKGFNSETQGPASPAGKDAHIAALIAATESAFVILADGKHYLIQNADRGILAQLVNQQVKVDGDADNVTDSIKAKDIYKLAPNKSWKKVWSSNVNDNIYRDVFGALPLSGK
jgi:hypothetical protein